MEKPFCFYQKHWANKLGERMKYLKKPNWAMVQILRRLRNLGLIVVSLSFH